MLKGRDNSMSNQQLPLFPTTVVGSMPRSDFVRDLLALENEIQRSEDEIQREMDAAVRYIIALQEAAGLTSSPMASGGGVPISV